jgi:hypothetical protein
MKFFVEVTTLKVTLTPYFSSRSFKHSKVEEVNNSEVDAIP